MDDMFFFIVSVLVVGLLLIAVIALTRKGGTQLDVNKYRMKWMAIEKQMKKDEASSLVIAVLNADKLLDLALKEKQTRGDTMGERMKQSKALWSNANDVWNAHKLRNRIAHEDDIQISYNQARQAMAGFKQALKDLGAI